MVMRSWVGCPGAAMYLRVIAKGAEGVSRADRSHDAPRGVFDRGRWSSSEMPNPSRESEFFAVVVVNCQLLVSVPTRRTRRVGVPSPSLSPGDGLSSPGVDALTHA